MNSKDLELERSIALTKWDDLPCLTILPTISDPIFRIDVLPESVDTVNVAVMQEENWIEAYTPIIDKNAPFKVRLTLPAYSFADCHE